MTTSTQLKLGFVGSKEIQEAKKPELSNGRANKLDPQDRAFHAWYRFVLSFPPHLVQDYIQKFGLNQKSVILDPFCGTGTTLVEAKLAGMIAIGLEGNPFPHFASSVKTNWDFPFFSNWLFEKKKIANDLRQVEGKAYPDTKVHLADARSFDIIEPNSVDAVITSPPYPNEKDYTRP